MSSTLMLHAVTLPYIVKLTGETISREGADDANEVVLFKASRLTILGTESTSQFKSDEIVKGQMTHPFSNFEARGSWYFIDSRNISDVSWRKFFS